MFNCEMCGKEFPKRFYIKGPFENVCMDCFSKKYWQLIIAEKDKHLIINGVCYCIGNTTNGVLEYNGYGGQQFTIKKDDGKIIETNNLWYQGEIPEELKEQLPNNAEFME